MALSSTTIYIGIIHHNNLLLLCFDFFAFVSSVNQTTQLVRCTTCKKAQLRKESGAPTTFVASSGMIVAYQSFVQFKVLGNDVEY